MCFCHKCEFNTIVPETQIEEDFNAALNILLARQNHGPFEGALNAAALEFLTFSVISSDESYSNDESDSSDESYSSGESSSSGESYSSDKSDSNDVSDSDMNGAQ